MEEKARVSVFLFYTAGFDKNGAGLVLEIVCLGALLTCVHAGGEMV